MPYRFGSIENKYLSTGEVGHIVQVHRQTVAIWIRKGILPGFRTPGGQFRVTAFALLQFLRQYNMPIPQVLLDVEPRLVVNPPHSIALTSVEDPTTYLEPSRSYRSIKLTAPDTEERPINMAKRRRRLAEQKHKLAAAHKSSQLDQLDQLDQSDESSL